MPHAFLAIGITLIALVIRAAQSYEVMRRTKGLTDSLMKVFIVRIRVA